MAFNYNHVSNKKVFCGMTGSGKTISAMQWVLESNYRFYFIFDHDGQFGNRTKLKPAFNADQMLAQLKAQRFVIYNPSEMFGDMRGDANIPKRAGAFDWFCGYVFLMAEKIPQRLDGPKLLYADEIQDLATVHKVGIKTQQCITSGRNRSLDFTGAGVQYNLFNHVFRAGVSELYAFKTVEENAVKDLSALGFNPDEIKNLPLGSYVMRDIRGNERRGKVF